MATMNAREEVEDLLLACGEHVDMTAARFRFPREWCEDRHDGVHEHVLHAGHTPDEREACMKRLDFEYDDGFGTQYVDGTIWLDDGTWIERGEYDGSEWWRRVVRPPLPTREDE